MPTLVHPNVLLDGFDAIAGEDIVAGELVSVRLDGLAYVACAATGLEELPALGMAEEGVDEGAMGHFKHLGAVRGLGTTVDGYYYTSNTPGVVSTTAGNTSQVVAWANPAVDGGAFLDFEKIDHDHPADS